MSDSMIQCPGCGGTGKIIGLARMTSGPCREIRMNCLDCKGSGEVTSEHLEWRERGEIIRQERIARDRSLGEEARRRGMRPVDLADMEHGRTEPIRDKVEYGG